jgi:hypothetical protein
MVRASDGLSIPEICVMMISLLKCIHYCKAKNPVNIHVAILSVGLMLFTSILNEVRLSAPKIGDGTI